MTYLQFRDLLLLQVLGYVVTISKCARFIWSCWQNLNLDVFPVPFLPWWKITEFWLSIKTFPITFSIDLLCILTVDSKYMSYCHCWHYWDIVLLSALQLYPKRMHVLMWMGTTVPCRIPSFTQAIEYLLKTEVVLYHCEIKTMATNCKPQVVVWHLPPSQSSQIT